MAIAAVAALNVNFSSQDEVISSVTLANVEALANSETSSRSRYHCCGNYGTCVTTSSGDRIWGTKQSAPC